MRARQVGAAFRRPNIALVLALLAVPVDAQSPVTKLNTRHHSIVTQRIAISIACWLRAWTRRWLLRVNIHQHDQHQ